MPETFTQQLNMNIWLNLDYPNGLNNSLLFSMGIFYIVFNLCFFEDKKKLMTRSFALCIIND